MPVVDQSTIVRRRVNRGNGSFDTCIHLSTEARSVVRLCKLVLSCVAVVATAAALVSSPTIAGGATKPSSSVKATAAFSTVANPVRNSVPVPDYNDKCWAGGAKGAAATASCHSRELAAVNHQHAVEHIPPIVLPRNYWTLAPALQMFVITNLERVSRGLKPVVGVNAQMSQWAATAARRSSDAAVGAWNLSNGSELQVFGSVWAADLNSLDADFMWMYADGWSANGSDNADCTSAKAAGCWGHRQVVLGRFGGSKALVAGVGSLAHYLAKGELNSDAEAIASYTGPAPKFTYTWSAAVAAGARG
jgi:hypothetical protein